MKFNYPISYKIAFLILLLTGAVKESKAQYCTPTSTYGCSSGDYIQSFSTTNGITNITNNNTGCTGTLTYYSTMSHTAALGSTVNFSLTNCPSWTETHKIYVDWNLDQDWSDPGEEVYSNTGISGGTTVTGSFTVPATATPGTSRMRVRCAYFPSSTWDACSNESFSEAEDYDFIILSPCVAPTNLGATNITSSTATVSWTPPSPSIGSDYIVTTSATPPTTGFTSTTGTTGNVTGLTPSTQYYLYVRNKCSTSSVSMWVPYTFQTLPPCMPPVNFKTTNLQPTSTTINWDPWPSAVSYDYLVDQTPTDPTTTTGLTNTTATNANITGLTENTWYYVHIRSLCYGNEVSNWGLDSFLTPIPCRSPVIKIEHINTDHAVAYWDAVPSALHYEYALTTSSTPPALGTKYDRTAVQTSSLYDGKDYYIHVRAICNSVGVSSTSDWGTASFKTFPVSVPGVNNDNTVIEAYPNPVKGTLNINVYGLIKNNASVTLVDVNGKVLRQLDINTAKTAIDMSDIASGVYLLKYMDDNRSETIRITKQ